jgi:hypothetical protein
MTNVYFDASALLPLFFEDEFSDRAKRLLIERFTPRERPQRGAAAGRSPRG